MDTLLILEDDLSTRSRLVNIFKRKSYLVLSASNLQDAYRLFQARQPDCILMDLHFPEGHSIDNFYADMLILQERKGACPCPVVVLTASDAQEDIQELLACGIYTVHSKHDPIDLVEDSIRREILASRRASLRLIQGGKKVIPGPSKPNHNLDKSSLAEGKRILYN